MEFHDSMTNNNATLYNNLKNHHILKPLLNGFLTGEGHALFIYGALSILLPTAQSDPVLKKQLPKSIIEIPLITVILLNLSRSSSNYVLL